MRFTLFSRCFPVVPAAFALTALATAANAQTVAYYRFEDGANGVVATTITDSGPNALNGVSAGTTTLTYTNNVPPFATAGSLALDGQQ